MQKSIYSRITAIAIITSVATGFLITSPSVNACAGEEPYLGTICMTANTYCPHGYAEADGSLMPISANTALFSLIGTNYGGDGRTTFGLPDLRGRSPVGIGQGPGISPVSQGEKRGQESVTLLQSQMPAHTHSADASGASAKVQVSQEPGADKAPTGSNYLAAPKLGTNSVKLYNDGENLVDLAGVSGGAGEISIGATGGSKPIPTIPPQTAVRFCIAIQGVYPPRN